MVLRLLSGPPIRSRRANTIALAAAVVLLVSGHLYVGLRAAFLPCTLDCGETYESYIGARNLHRFGLGHAGGLQDYAVGQDPAAHPTLYIHNPNVGMYFLYLLFLLGIDDVHTQAALVTIPFGAGILYLYLYVRNLSRSVVMAALVLLSAGSTHLLVGLWAFNALRAFSWLLTFGALYHLDRYARRGRRRRLHLLATVFCLGLAIGVDYPFALFLAITVMMLGHLRLIPLPVGRLVLIVVLAIGVSFALRQVQVVAGVGAQLWAMDFAASVVRRVPVVGLLLGVPDDATLQRMYGDLNVVKFPGGGAFTPRRWVQRLINPYAYALGSPFLILAVVWGLVLLVLRRADVRQLVRREGRPVVAVCYLALALGSGVAGSFLVFADYVSTFYGYVLMPMVVHWVVVLLAVTMYLLIAHRKARTRLGRYAVPVGALVLVGFVVWRVGTELRNHVLLPPRPYPGQAVLREIEGHSVVTLWISSAVSTYTGEWAAALNHARWTSLGPGDLPFEPRRDYYVFMEADRDNPRYRRPDFFFVPALNLVGFDHRVCRPPRGRIATNADGCSNLEEATRKIGPLPLYRRGEDFVLYDLRASYPPRKGN